MHRILFVDDEPAVLDGLRNVFRKQRRSWEMVFAPGGREALEELEKAPFAVVVSDMRMPGIDGLELLQRVKEGYPSIARIVLSGHAEPEAVAKVLPVANHYAAKPCDVDALRVAIERACGLHALLENQDLRRVMGRIHELRAVPGTYLELTRAVAGRDPSGEEKAAILEKDEATSAWLGRLARSTCPEPARAASSVAQLAGQLRFEMLKGLALMANALSILEGAGPLDPDLLGRFERSSVLAARIARRMAASAWDAEAFTVGLVHDLGTIVLALELGSRLEDVVGRAAAEQRPFHLVEKEALGVAHAEVGAYLLASWGLPLHMVEAVAHHHTPSEASRHTCGTLEIVHVADWLTSELLGKELGLGRPTTLDVTHLAGLGVLERLPAWRAVAEDEFHRRWGGEPLPH